MFGWLTRNDGARKERIKRRLKSPRGSVFSEFAIVMPIVLLMCSAIFELLGFWDAQVMANHAAWQVGRIAAVRGHDGMAFSDDLSKISKTGVVSEKMPEPIKAALKPLVQAIGGTIDKFNDRGVITTMFLMSTCEIGYYGPSPSQALSEGLEGVIDAAVKGLVEELPSWAEEFCKQQIDWIPAGQGAIGKMISDIINTIVNAAVKPIMDALAGVLKQLAKKLVELLNLDELFSGGSAAARRARQIYGAAARVVKAPAAVSAVSELDDMDGPFVFAEGSVLDTRLAYPLVIDKKASSDGYFITGAHGWPPNNQALRLVKVEVNWPYSRGWLFPVVSGYGKTSAPVAKGTSIAFPQPGITDKNLWSTGAVEYADGDYENKMSDAYKAVADAMRQYLALAQFGMKYRLRREDISLVDEKPEWYHIGSPKHCSPLYELFEKNKGGDYANCWSAITGGQSQSAYMDNLKDFFDPSSYRYRDYFYWEETWHKRYSSSIVSANGQLGYWAWCQTYPQYCASANRRGVAGPDRLHFEMLVDDYAKWHGAKDWYRIFNSYKSFQNKVDGFCLMDIVKWKDPDRYQHWFSTDMQVQQASKDKADKRFDKVKTLLEAEIQDIQNVLDGNMGEYTGNNGNDFIIDPDDQQAIDNPEEASKQAMEKWLARKEQLKGLLQEIDSRIESLNNSWLAYKNAGEKLMRDRKNAVGDDLARAYIGACYLEYESCRDGKAFSEQKFAELMRRHNLLPYDIVGKTDEFSCLQNDYCAALEESFKAELEYGVQLGLESAKKTEKTGKSIDELDFGKDVFPEGHGGTLGPGSDSDWPIDGDNQRWTPTGGWQ